MDTCQVEQAIFASSELDGSDAYHVVAISPGISGSDIEELATWGPVQSSLLDPMSEAVSLNFHPLPSGAYCIGRTTPRGIDGDGCMQLSTQNLIVSPDQLLKFRNHPIRLYQAALAQGVLRWYDQFPSRLPSVQLPVGPMQDELKLIGELSRKPGIEWMSVMMQTALDTVTTGIIGGPPAIHVISGLISCLPIECRPEFTFSTGLRFTPRRPFRLLGLGCNEEERDRVRRMYNITVLDLNTRSPEVNDLFEAWPQLIYRILHAHDLPLLGRCLEELRPGLTLQDLSLLGLEWMEEFDRTALSRSETPVGNIPASGDRRRPSHDKSGGPNWSQALDTSSGDLPAGPIGNLSGYAPGGESHYESVELNTSTESFFEDLLPHSTSDIGGFGDINDSNENDRDSSETDSQLEQLLNGEEGEGVLPDVMPGDLPTDISGPPSSTSGDISPQFTPDQFEKLILHAHEKFFGPSSDDVVFQNAANELRDIAPSHQLAQKYPELADDLQLLDDYVFGVIHGSKRSLDQFTKFWPKFCRRIENEQVRREICEQHILFVLELLNGRFDPSEVNHFEKTAGAIDFICMMDMTKI